MSFPVVFSARCSKRNRTLNTLIRTTFVFALTVIYTLKICDFWMATRIRAFTREQYHLDREGDATCDVVINGYNRETLLGALALHYSSMSLVKRVYVNWGNTKRKPMFLTDLLRTFQLEYKVRVIRRDDDDLNDRFKPVPELDDHCVIIADDDIFVPEEDIITLHSVWSRYGNSIAGFFPRSHEFVGVERELTYTGNPKEHFSMILTKFLMVKNSALSYYTYDIPQAVRTYVSNKNNCEDIALNFAVSDGDANLPVYVRSDRKFDFGSANGLYSRPGHLEDRSQCLKDIPRLLGKPLPRYSHIESTLSGEKRFAPDHFIKYIGWRGYLTTFRLYVCLRTGSDRSLTVQKLRQILW